MNDGADRGDASSTDIDDENLDAPDAFLGPSRVVPTAAEGELPENFSDVRGGWLAVLRPRWSPDGRFLLALTADAENSLSRNILLFDFRLQKWKKLVDHIVNEPVWSHDQRYIYFDQLGTQVQAAIFRVRVSDGRIEQLVALGDFLRAPDRNFGDWFGLAPDDSPLLLREVRKTEIYALDVRW